MFLATSQHQTPSDNFLSPDNNASTPPSSQPDSLQNQLQLLSCQYSQSQRLISNLKRQLTKKNSTISELRSLLQNPKDSPIRLLPNQQQPELAPNSQMLQTKINQLERIIKLSITPYETLVKTAYEELHNLIRDKMEWMRKQAELIQSQKAIIEDNREELEELRIRELEERVKTSKLMREVDGLHGRIREYQKAQQCRTQQEIGWKQNGSDNSEVQDLRKKYALLEQKYLREQAKSMNLHLQLEKLQQQTKYVKENLETKPYIFLTNQLQAELQKKNQMIENLNIHKKQTKVKLRLLLSSIIQLNSQLKIKSQGNIRHILNQQKSRNQQFQSWIISEFKRIGQSYIFHLSIRDQQIQSLRQIIIDLQDRLRCFQQLDKSVHTFDETLAFKKLTQKSRQNEQIARKTIVRLLNIVKAVVMKANFPNQLNVKDLIKKAKKMEKISEMDFQVNRILLELVSFTGKIEDE